MRDSQFRQFTSIHRNWRRIDKFRQSGGAAESLSALWLTTTNDNLNALRFYQKRGFVLIKIHRNAVEIARQYKPIPLIGMDGIAVRDEIELELALKDAD